jgi:hypothetical protein
MAEPLRCTYSLNSLRVPGIMKVKLLFSIEENVQFFVPRHIFTSYFLVIVRTHTSVRQRAQSAAILLTARRGEEKLFFRKKRHKQKAQNKWEGGGGTALLRCVPPPPQPGRGGEDSLGCRSVRPRPRLGFHHLTQL